MDQEKIHQRVYELTEKLEEHKRNPFKINISRGIPSPEQLALSKDLFNILDTDTVYSEDPVDIRNYGGLLGIQEARTLFGKLMGISAEETVVGGNASLQLMYIVLNMLMNTDDQAWVNQGYPIKFLCPSPGYDRHWNILNRLGIEMIPVPMTGHGPEMDMVEKWVQEDETIKGIFCVPKYSNPTGEVYSNKTIERLAQLETKSDDFVILWDNAYIVHHLTEERVEIKNILEEAKKHHNEDRIYQFVSTSKMTFPGSGVAAIGTSKNNVAKLVKELSSQIISFDKINQKRQVAFLKDIPTIEQLMDQHAQILQPKFAYILEELNKAFSANGWVKWSEPKGGYFIHLETKEGLASEIVSKMNEIGIKLTPANAAYPNGDNPLDNSIRLAPSFASIEELKSAIPALIGIIELVTIDKIS